MESEMERYVGPPTTRYAYAKEFWVECPKCAKAARVIKKDLMGISDDKLVCQHCNYSETAEDRVRYTATVSRACRNCGESIEVSIPNNRVKVAELKYSCPHCHVPEVYKPANTPYRLKYSIARLADPVFSLPLWFQENVKGDTFWASNKEHLLEIRSYVTAKLRERQTMRITTMVEKLPQFIKAAKNREVVLKAIERMLRK
ncbi:hypothetical protein SAMN04487996_11263 [Dyadobacter soli]|uniref:Replication restart DNA helicase PriA n=1 Tax=Dyadobacter soli TaxID=659014 RepID=A0A1G7NI23_9BACT|nr:hypothetical protein [Dyadobacter soli]SDF73738.1 hypothetical protein SAMN04487996_11263 [Dyadobacter soli]